MDITKISDEQLYKLFRDTIKEREIIEREYVAKKEVSDKNLRLINAEIEKREAGEPKQEFNKAKEIAKAKKKEVEKE